MAAFTAGAIAPSVMQTAIIRTSERRDNSNLQFGKDHRYPRWAMGRIRPFCG